MEPTFVDREAFTVMGLQERFTPDTEDFEGIWKRFMAFHDQIQPHSTDQAYYGVCFSVAGGERRKDYVAGMAVPPGTACPEGLVIREVPAARDAVFECTVATIRNTYDHIFKEWLPAAPADHHPTMPGFERYPPGTDSGDSPVRIHVPVQAKK